MKHKTLYCAGSTAAIGYAAQHLRNYGYTITTEPGWDTAHLLLDVPSFQGNALRGGGNVDTLIQSLPKDSIIWGGNLIHPALDGFRTVDLLKDEIYLARNAAITAHCALNIITSTLPCTPDKAPVLIIGWGRIGKCLGKLFAAMGNSPVIAARSLRDRACLSSLGYEVADPADLDAILPRTRILINTAPAPVLTDRQVTLCTDCLKVDLASQRGIPGEDVVVARGLPGVHAPESSGQLIAETFMRLSKEVTS